MNFLCVRVCKKNNHKPLLKPSPTSTFDGTASRNLSEFFHWSKIRLPDEFMGQPPDNWNQPILCHKNLRISSAKPGKKSRTSWRSAVIYWDLLITATLAFEGAATCDPLLCLYLTSTFGGIKKKLNKVLHLMVLWRIISWQTLHTVRNNYRI